MIKSISFLEQFVPLIKQGQKTVTRRIRTNLVPGDICYFKTGRLGKKLGYLKIYNVTVFRLLDIMGNMMELYREGFSGEYTVKMNEFIGLWDKLNNKKGCRWGDNPKVYRIKFEYLGEKLNEDS